MKNRPNILTIAGFDPSSGAGVTADIKTMESIGCYGLAVCTANTVQNDITFSACHWVDVAIIKEQIQILFERFQIDFVKIGIVENWSVLKEIIELLHQKNPRVKIVLDPVLNASSSFEFHDDDSKLLDELLDKIYLITPNFDEIKSLFKDKSIEQAIKHISSKTNLFLTGGHRTDAVGKDELFTTANKKVDFFPQELNITEKHGSGCVLSSAIISYLCLEGSLENACLKGKRYTEKVLSSNESLLGYHG